MSERTPSAEKAEVSLRIGVSPDEFRVRQDECVRALASILGCKENEIEIHGVHPAIPETSSDFIDACQLRMLGERGLTEY